MFCVHFTCLIPSYFVSEQRSLVGEKFNFFCRILFFVFLNFDSNIFFVFWAFFAVFATVSDTGSGGNTDRHHDVLYLCFIVVIF